MRTDTVNHHRQKYMPETTQKRRRVDALEDGAGERAKQAKPVRRPEEAAEEEEEGECEDTEQ